MHILFWTTSLYSLGVRVFVCVHLVELGVYITINTLPSDQAHIPILAIIKSYIRQYSKRNDPTLQHVTSKMLCIKWLFSFLSNLPKNNLFLQRPLPSALKLWRYTIQPCFDAKCYDCCIHFESCGIEHNMMTPKFKNQRLFKTLSINENCLQTSINFIVILDGQMRHSSYSFGNIAFQ